MDTLFQLPFPFHLSALVLVMLLLVAWQQRYLGWGAPMGAVLATVAAWYHGDALYNDYEEYRILMGDAALSSGWWQVLIFLIAFGLLVPLVHGMMNSRYHGRRSNLMIYFETRRLEHPIVQHQIDKLTMLMAGAWGLLMLIALLLVDFNFLGLFAPYLEGKDNPWSRRRVGGGLDSLISLGSYLQVFLTAGFGVLAAVSRNPSTRSLAIVICVLAFPFYIFDRTRNTMLATMLPGLLAWVLFRLRGGLVVKGGVLLGAFMIISFWFSFVVANRNDQSMANALKSSEAIEAAEDTRHEGLSMFSELGYMNSFFEKGTFKPNWGARYFAELVNPVPRVLWKGKPLAGVDYAIARGFGATDGEGVGGGGITASIATGMIGQGVVNFGRIFGPIAAAFLMALWVAVLARQDLLGHDPARLLLYSCGMILTFNMGRDITLLVLYPFVFGLMIILVRNWYFPPSSPQAPVDPSGGRNRSNRRFRRNPHRRRPSPRRR
jgi:hypothetical protein